MRSHACEGRPGCAQSHVMNEIRYGLYGGGGGAHPLLPLIAAKSQKRQRHSAATAAFNHVSGNISLSKPQMI